MARLTGVGQSLDLALSQKNPFLLRRSEGHRLRLHGQPVEHRIANIKQNNLIKPTIHNKKSRINVFLFQKRCIFVQNRTMELKAGHRKALLDILNILKEDSESQQKMMEEARKDNESQEYKYYLHVQDWLIDQQLDLIRRAIVDNEIDY